MVRLRSILENRDVIVAMYAKKHKLLKKLSSVKLDLTRHKSAAELIHNTGCSSSGNSAAYLQPLPVPKFSGYVKDWIELRSSWHALMINLPKNIQGLC